MGERRRRKNYIIFLICLVFFIFLTNIFSRDIRSFFYFLSNPIQTRLWDAGLNASNFFKGIFSIGSTKDEINALKQQNAELQTQLVLLKETQDENTLLKEALGLGLNNKYKLILGKFVSKDVNSDSVTLNRGSTDGVKLDMPIVTSGGIIAGKITEVHENYSKAILLSDKTISFAVRIKHNDKDISAVGQGKGNSNISLNLIPKEEVSDGDMVVTDSLGGIFPELLGVGKVKNIKKNDTSPFWEAEVEPFFNLTQSREIFIISSNL